MEVKVTLSNGVTEYMFVDEFLKIIRIDVFTFIYDFTMNTAVVYVGEDDLEYIAEFKSEKFDKEVCIEYLEKSVSSESI